MTQSKQELATSLTISRTINAPREWVYQAWTDPEQLRVWWGVQEDWTAPITEIDVRVGGKYRLGMLQPGHDAPHIVGGEYKEVQPPEKLVFTWTWEKPASDTSDWVPAETLVTLEFLDKNGSTEVILTHEQFPDENSKNEHEGGWNGCLTQLTRLVEAA